MNGRRTLLIIFSIIWAAHFCGGPSHAQDAAEEEHLRKLKLQIDALDVKPTDPVDMAMLDMLKNIAQHLETVDQQIKNLNDNVASLTEPQQSKVYLDILGNMDLDLTDRLAIRDKFMRSVQGNLVIQNEAEYDVHLHLYVFVNGVGHHVPRFKRTEKNAVRIRVPFGRVTTQICWYDKVGKKWCGKRGPRETWPKDLDNNWKIVTDGEGKQQLMLPLFIE